MMQDARQRIGALLTALSVLSASACAAETARLYSTDVASPPLEMRYKGGRAWIGEQKNPTCEGEYRTSESDIWGSGSGSAVLTCGNGRVLDCQFQFSGFTGQGAGTCLDNEQRRYRVLF